MSNGQSTQNAIEAPLLTPAQIQQEYFENLPNCDWIKYESKNRGHLKQNVAFALFGSPSVEGDLVENDNLEGYTSRQKERVMKVYYKICEYGKFSLNNEDIFLSILLIVSATPKPLKFYQIAPSNYWLDLHLRNDIDIFCTTVFKIRKCIPTMVDAKCCSVYIDDNARVYQTWDSYLSMNLLPKCVLIAPENGEYQGVLVEGESGKEIAVKLTVAPSPALGLKSRVLSSADTVSTVVSLGTVGVLGAAVFTPVGPAVLAGAVVATVATGVYGIIRSSLHLHDRRVHEQSINPLRAAEARGSWLNIAASGVGLGASAASSLLTRSAVAGTNLTKSGQLLVYTVDTLRYANLLTGSAGALHSLVYLVVRYHKHGETPTKLELFQFSVSILFFYQAVMSNRTAQTIVEDAQANTINEIGTTLRSNRHRKIFDKLSAESRRVKGTVHGNTEVINGIKNIANKDQYFADVLRINKDLNKHKLRISMTADGRVNLNAAHKFDPSQLSGLAKESRAQLFSNLGPADLSKPNVPTKLFPSQATARTFEGDDNSDTIRVGIRPEEVLRIGVYLVRVSASGPENIAALLESVSKEAYDAIITLAMNIISKLVPEDIAKMKLLSPNQDLIEQVVRFIFNYLKHKRPMGDPSWENDNSIVILLKEFFQHGCVRKETIIYLKDRFLKWVAEELERRETENPNKKRVTCESCGGVRYDFASN